MGFDQVRFVEEFQSKAFAKSYNIPPTCIFWLMDLNTMFVRMKAALSVDSPLCKPNFSGTNMLLICI
jgi:hypothetical protein